MNNVKNFIIAVIAMLSLASCSEEAPARMMWEVSATPSENVKAAFDPMYYYQIQIIADGEAGEVILKCTNYRTLVLTGVKNEKGEYVDVDCHYTAISTEPGVVRISLEKMPEGFNEIKSLLQIEGTDGKATSFTSAEVTRKP